MPSTLCSSPNSPRFRLFVVVAVAFGSLGRFTARGFSVGVYDFGDAELHEAHLLFGSEFNRLARVNGDDDLAFTVAVGAFDNLDHVLTSLSR